MENEFLSNTQREKDKLERLLMEVYRKILEKQKPLSYQEKLAKQLIDEFHDGQTPITFSVPQTFQKAIVEYCGQHGIANMPTDGLNGMSFMIVSRSRFPEVQKFIDALTVVTQQENKIVDAKTYFATEKALEETSSTVFEYKDKFQKEDEAFIKESIIAKLHGSGKYGHNAIDNENILVLRHDGALDDNIHTPDLLQAFTETAIDTQNVTKRITKDIARHIENKEIQNFVDMVAKSKNAFLADRYHPNNSFLEFNAKTQSVYLLRPEMQQKIEVLSAEKLREISEKNPHNFKEALYDQIETAARKINNIETMTEQAKAKADLQSPQDIELLQKEDMKASYEGLKQITELLNNPIVEQEENIDQIIEEKVQAFIQSSAQQGIELTDESTEVMDYREKLYDEYEAQLLNGLGKAERPSLDEIFKENPDLEQMFKVRPTFDADMFAEIYQSNMEFSVADSPLLNEGFTLDAVKDVYSERIADYVKAQSGLHMDYTMEEKRDLVYEQLQQDLQEETGIFKDFMDNDTMIPILMDRTDNEFLKEVYQTSDISQFKENIKETFSIMLENVYSKENYTLENVDFKDIVDYALVHTKEPEKTMDKTDKETVLE